MLNNCQVCQEMKEKTTLTDEEIIDHHKGKFVTEELTDRKTRITILNILLAQEKYSSQKKLILSQLLAEEEEKGEK